MEIAQISKNEWLIEITGEDKRKLACIINKLKNKTELPIYGSWKNMSTEKIWSAILDQFCVMGSARPIDKLKENAGRYNDFLDKLSVRTLSIVTSERREYIANNLHDFKATRFYNKNAERINNCFGDNEVIRDGKIVLFADCINDEINEDKMRDGLLNKQSYFKIKSVSDFMITIGAARSFIAFDTRVVGLFNKHFGLDLKVGKIQSNETLYKSLEKMLRETCRELGIDLSLLDRMLFRYNSTINYILETECG